MPQSEKDYSSLDRTIEKLIVEQNIPGLALAITDKDKTLYANTYGYSNREAKTPLTPQTLFEIGSIGKSFTSIVFQQLVDAGHIDLHAPVTDYLPWFMVQSDYAPITCHHLLSHTAGIIGGTDFSGDTDFEIYALRETKTASPPGTFFHYSNIGYKALGVVLETLLRKPYREIIRDRILYPLQMSDSEPAITHDLRDRFAVPYGSAFDDRPAGPDTPLAPATWLETDTADGCIASTAEDMAKVIRVFLNRGQNGVLSEAGFERMTTPVIDRDDTPYGYGLSIKETPEGTIISHSGGMVGYTSRMQMNMDQGLGVIILVNRNGWDGFESLADYLVAYAEAVINGGGLPSAPASPDPYHVENATDYIGTYSMGGRILHIVAEEDHLFIETGGEPIPLVPRGEDRFHAAHPALDRFLLIFGRNEQGQVVEIGHGNDWYINDKYNGPTEFEYSDDLNQYPGHYRCHNPWFSNFRVVLRKGELKIVMPDGDEQLLVPVHMGEFLVGADERIPEILQFDTVIEGRARRAKYATCNFYRFFTP